MVSRRDTSSRRESWRRGKSRRGSHRADQQHRGLVRPFDIPTKPHRRFRGRSPQRSNPSEHNRKPSTSRLVACCLSSRRVRTALCDGEPLTACLPRASGKPVFRRGKAGVRGSSGPDTKRSRNSLGYGAVAKTHASAGGVWPRVKSSSPANIRFRKFCRQPIASIRSSQSGFIA